VAQTTAAHEGGRLEAEGGWDAAPASRHPPSAARGVGWGQIFWRFLKRDKIGAAAFAVFAVFVFLAVFGPLLTPDEKVTDLTKLYSQPSREHILGTD
jgi:ABC-type dipeptide/oligopeptide/nickel transport system permease subunit